MGNSAQYSWGTVDPEKIKQAETQFCAQAATFNKLLEKCRQKCMGHEYGEGELAKGEATCTDRCVTKYIHANKLVGDNFREQNMNPWVYMAEYDKVKLMMNEANNNN